MISGFCARIWLLPGALTVRFLFVGFVRIRPSSIAASSMALSVTCTLLTVFADSGWPRWGLSRRPLFSSSR